MDLGDHHIRISVHRSTSIFCHRKVLSIVAGLVFLCMGSRPSLGQSEASPDQTIPRIPSNTAVEAPDAERWNAIVLLARPRIASGDVNSLPSSIRSTVSSFILTILATVESSSHPVTGEPKYRLKEVGVGYSMNVDGRLTTVTLADYSKLGLQLGFFQRQMLSTNEQQLDTARAIARTSTLTMLDTPAILLRDGKHQDFVMRHFIWIDSSTGKNSALVWLLRKDSRGNLTIHDEPIRWVPAGTKEDRAIHVDGDEFLLGGIPTERAFALENLPPGKDIAWTTASKQLAAKTEYDVDALRDLTIALNEAMRNAKKQAVSSGEPK